MITYTLVAFNKFNKKIEYKFKDVDDLHAATMNAYRLTGTMGLTFGWVYKND